MKYFQEIKNNFFVIDSSLSEYAVKSDEAVRFTLEDDEEEIRPPFFHDADRIIHAMSYTRYTNKTQVYSFLDNDHISMRMIHVQLVSKIARTIGRALGLNTDLIEAIALGHDIGHTPLGHFGEAVLDEISYAELGEHFAHNVQGVRNYMFIENKGRGLNLSVQVLDGILCHNGEILSSCYSPQKKDKEEVLREYFEAYQDIHLTSSYRPMTLEGCVVRISDVIGYVGRDIEDAIRLNKIKRENIPLEIVSVLGSTNREIVNTLVMDIIDNSYGLACIKMSESVYSALEALKKFNYDYIYRYSSTEKERSYYREGMKKIYQRYVRDLEAEDRNSIIYRYFLDSKEPVYFERTPLKRMAIDFIAGMTDGLFLSEIEKEVE